jgi:hypothetical protein
MNTNEHEFYTFASVIRVHSRLENLTWLVRV